MLADGAAALIRDGDTVALIGGGGGLMEATCLFAAVERRFLATGHPRHVALHHSLGIGDHKTRGLNCFAHEGLVRKVTGGQDDCGRRTHIGLLRDDVAHVGAGWWDGAGCSEMAQ